MLYETQWIQHGSVTTFVFNIMNWEKITNYAQAM